ncbi:MAG: ATP-binding protein [Methanoregula sp.]|jgi:signal transduction histidine kinase
MNGNSAKKQGMSYFLLILYVLVILIFAMLLFIVSSALNLSETLFTFLQHYASLQLSELAIVSIFLDIAFAALIIRLWRELKQAERDQETKETRLAMDTAKLAFLNSVLNLDVLNQLTELAGDEAGEDKKIEINKVKTTVTRIDRQIKFIKEYQDIGSSPPEWQHVPDVIMRARVGLNAGKVMIDVDMRDVEIFADRLLEKGFYYMIDNALKHGGENLSRIRFTDHTLDTTLVIVCEDDGVGIHLKKRASLFPETYGRHGGYGLFFIKEVLAATNITIKETSAPGNGARFEIHVPGGVHRLQSR